MSSVLKATEQVRFLTPLVAACDETRCAGRPKWDNLRACRKL